MGDETLEWDLKVDADTSGGTKMDAVLGRLDATLGRVADHLARTEEASKKAGHGHEQHGRHARGLLGAFERLIHNGMEPFLHKAKEIAEFEFIREGTEKLLELPKELAEKVYELGEEMLKAAAKEERMGLAFRNALGAEDAEATEEYIDRIAKHTEFTKDALEAMNLELAKSGFHGADLARANEAAIDLAAMSANPEEGAGTAVSALKRLMTSGKLDARALRPFGISTKDFFAELSKETGIGVATLQKQMQKGKVDVGTSLNSLYTVITNKTGKALGGAGADMEKTFNARLKNMKEIPELIGEKLKGTRGYAAISDFVGKIGEQFAPDGELGKKIFAGMESIIDTIGDQLQGIDLKEVATTITDDIIPAVKAMASSILFVVDAIERVIRGFHRMKNLVVGPSFDEGPAVAARRAERREKNKVEALFPEKTADVAGAKVHHGAFHLVGGDEAEGLKKSLPAFHEAGVQAGAEVEKGFRKKTKTHSPSELFAELGRDIASGLAVGLDDSTEEAERAFARLMQPAVAAGAGAGAGASGGGGPTVQVTLQPTIRIDGAGMDADQIADAIQEKLTEIAPGALQSALEQVAMQTGSAT